MSKVKAPLFSFEARGKLADSLVYFPWKGVDAIRSYVIPANPQTSAQQTQRSYMTDAVAEWHAASYTADDVTAWNRLAGISDRIMSGFNRMVQEFVNEAILGNTWERLRNLTFSNVLATSIDVTVEKATGGNAPTVRWGVRKTALLNSAAMTDNLDGTWTYTIPNLTASTLYYISVDVGTSGTDWARLGIYQQRTTA